MTEQSPGLRFDIYERVHLSEEVDGIESLETVELTPHIELFTEEDTAILRGHLLLAGQLSSQLRQQSVAFEHRIPVEISMPVERMERVESVGVEIEHFDVDLTQGGGLSVTGVLTLRGLKSTTPVMENWDQGEEMLFVHDTAQPARGQEQADALREADEAAYLVESFSAESTEEQGAIIEEEYVVQSRQVPDEATQVETASFVPEASFVEDVQPQEMVEVDSRIAEVDVVYVREEAEVEEQVEVVAEQVRSVQASDEVVAEVVEEQEREVSGQVAGIEDSEEVGSSMKIAISGKPAEDNAFVASHTLQEQILTPNAVQREQAVEEPISSPQEVVQQEQYQVQAADVATETVQGRVEQPEQTDRANQTSASAVGTTDTTPNVDQSSAANTSETSQTGGVAWKNLFLSRENSETRFSKLKMCIVQKEETLDTIADRYKLNPREIILYNRLTEQEVSEGQIIYIPLSS